MWRDLKDIYGGSEWRVEARNAIARADRVLLLLTEAAANSEAVEFEWRTAVEMGKRVVPLIISADAGHPQEIGRVHLAGSDSRLH